MRISAPYTDTDALQARLAARLVVALGEQAANLPRDLSERLRVSRDQAVTRAREVRRLAPAAATVIAGASRGGAAVLGRPTPWWQPMASLLPLLVLTAGLVLIGRWDALEQVQAAADIDSVLLADDLPPAAYSDPGFAEFLKSPLP